jgi:proteasome accessory factor B
MAARRTERLLNLVICLLAAKRYLSREQIRQSVPGYAESESDEAFERMFERDKDDLREMGIPLETGSNSAWFEDEVGYRINRDDYALPAVSFEPAELAVLGLAARVWQSATLAQAASQAILKLEASGVDVDASALATVEPRFAAAEPAFAPLYEAVRDARPVAFDYRRPGQPVARRDVEPWGIVSWHGRWYLVGHDRERTATRVFRLSRIAGEVTATGPAGSVSVPAEVNLRDQVRMLAPPTGAQQAQVRIRVGAVQPLRRRATSIEPDAKPDWEQIQVSYDDEESLAEEIVGFGPDAVAVAPAPVVDAVVRRLRAALAAAEAGR